MQDRTLSVEQAAAEESPPPAARNLGAQLYPRMVESRWLVSPNTAVMLDYALGRVSQRKLRLLAVACVRLLGSLVRQEWQHLLLQAAEAFADSQDCRAELERAVQEARLRRAAPPNTPDWFAAESVLQVGIEDARYAAHCVVRYSPWYAAAPPLGASQLADLLRHIFGNPFRPWPPLERPSTTLRQLAESVYAGESCAFALRDALLDAGHTDLAEHFQHDGHPKGCWALDAVLGKE